MNAVSGRIIDLWDSLLLYYSAFLNEKDRHRYKSRLDNLYHRLPSDQINNIKSILSSQRKQAKSDCSSDKKSRILNALLDNEERTLVIANLFKGITEQFMHFTKKYQAQRPLVHDLHSDLHNLIKEAYAGFLLPEKIPACSTSKLISLEFRDEYQLRDRDLAVGKFCKPVLTTCLKDKKKNIWINKFYQALREGDIGMGEYLKKLPVANTTIRDLSYLSPALQRNAKIVSAISSLAEKLPWVDLMLSSEHSALTRPWQEEK